MQYLFIIRVRITSQLRANNSYNGPGINPHPQGSPLCRRELMAVSVEVLGFSCGVLSTREVDRSIIIQSQLAEKLRNT